MNIRAKFKVAHVMLLPGGVEQIQFQADGSDEDNTFARFTPSASLNMTITNPALTGFFKPGATFYADLTPC